MKRREFLQASGVGLAAMALTRVPGFAAELADQKKRVGLIGSGWYGKIDLLRLIQVAPVEVVSLCDVDRRAWPKRPTSWPSRQLSKKKPRTYSDYREMLKEKDLDIVLIATPDHWHALPMIAAVQAGADVYVQKPIGVDVVECQAMVAAARKYQRVVQVGTQRRSTPHLFEARELIQEGRLGRIGLGGDLLLRPARHQQPARRAAAGDPRLRDVDRPGADAAVQQDHPPRQLAQLHGIRQRHHRRHGHPHDRHGALDDGPGLAQADFSSTGGNYFHKEGKPNIPDMQTATFDYGDLQVTWQHRHFGEGPDPKYRWGATFYGEKGTLKASVYTFDFTPLDGGTSIHREWNDANAKYPVDSDKFPEDKTEKRIEYHVAPAIREHMKDLLRCIASRGRPRADIAEGSTSTSHVRARESFPATEAEPDVGRGRRPGGG